MGLFHVYDGVTAVEVWRQPLLFAGFNNSYAGVSIICTAAVAGIYHQQKIAPTV